MLLYDNELSGNCYKIRLLFAQLGIDYTREEVDVFDRADREKVLGGVNPGLRIPTVLHLPEDAFQRARVLQWQFFEQYSHEPNIAVARFWAHAGIKPSPEVLEDKLRGGHAALKALDRHLVEREFVVDDHYTVADISLYAYTHVAPEGGFGLESYPAVRAWLERVAAQPGHVPIRAG
ncbi:MAG TPA: glutathione binding-like protein [Solirubrobacteraceae bacterium]